MQHAVLVLVAAISCFSYIIAASAALAYLAQPQQPNSTTFVHALANSSVSQIVLLTDYSVSSELDHLKDRPLQINRNISITGLAGTFPVLDLQWQRGKLLLCSTCVFTFSNLVIANERQGVGPAYDIFIGRPGSVVLGHNIYRLRYACTTAQHSAKVMLITNRSAVLPGGGEAQQLQFKEAVYQGRTYKDAVYVGNFTADIPYAVQEGREPSGGYALGDYNMTRLCMGIVDIECLQRMSSDTCVIQLIDRMRAADAAGSQSGHSTAVLAAAIAVPVAAVLLLSMAAALLLVRKRQRLRQQQLSGAGGDFKHGVKEMSGGESTENSSRHEPCDNNILQGPLGGNKQGWELTASRTAPLVGSVGDSRVHFGDLIGSGAFGLVYKARWAGQQVAVKVIEHDTSAAAAVTNEIQLLLSFDHPNIIRALHYVMYTQTSTTTSSNSGANGIGRRGSTDTSHTLLPVAAAGPAAASSTTAGSAAAAAAAAAGCRVRKSGVLAGVGVCSSRRASYHSTGMLLPLQEASRSSGGSRGLQHTTSGAESTSGSRGLQRSTSGAAGGNAAPGAGAGGDSGAGRDQAGSVTNNDNNKQQLGSHLGPVRAETWLVTEYCDLGTLHHTVQLIHEADSAPPGQLLSIQAKLWLLLLLQDAARGLQALHAQRTVHGDLNSRNVLVSSNASSQSGMVAKLADLGLSRVLLQHKTHRTTQTVGTMSHMAPEVLRYGRMSAASDVYSFGIMVHTVFTGEEAFRSLHYGQFFQTVVLEGRRPPLSAAVPADMLMLMERCWAADPADRPTADRLLELLGFLIQVRQQNLTPGII